MLILSWFGYFILYEELPGYYNNYAHRIYYRIIAMSGYKCAQGAYQE